MSVEAPAGGMAVDVPALMTRLEGDRGLLAELYEIFVQDAEGLLAALEKGVASSDAEAVQRAAHTLKGAVGNFCAPSAVDAAKALEAAGRTGKMTDAPRLLARLRAEIDAVSTALAALLPDSRLGLPTRTPDSDS